mmetsp:Transcript_4091/g.10536  ORF Transcript_4091/g.10536 Transcript_4091/m.10536 type:complete len:300 (-) Transcript_4091:244-1143(-)
MSRCWGCPCPSRSSSPSRCLSLYQALVRCRVCRRMPTRSRWPPTTHRHSWHRGSAGSRHHHQVPYRHWQDGNVSLVEEERGVVREGVVVEGGVAYDPTIVQHHLTLVCPVPPAGESLGAYGEPGPPDAIVTLAVLLPVNVSRIMVVSWVIEELLHGGLEALPLRPAAAFGGVDGRVVPGLAVIAIGRRDGCDGEEAIRRIVGGGILDKHGGHPRELGEHVSVLPRLGVVQELLGLGGQLALLLGALLGGLEDVLGTAGGECGAGEGECVGELVELGHGVVEEGRPCVGEGLVHDRVVHL